MQGLGAIGERHALLDVGPLALGDPLRQTAHGHRLPRQGGAQFLALGPWPGCWLRATWILQQGRHHLLGGARIRGNGVEAGDDGLLLLAALLPLAQAHGRPLGGGLHHRDPFAIGLHDQDRAGGDCGRGVSRLLIEERSHPLPRR